MDLKIYRNGLRDFLKDYEEVNRILKFEEENNDNLLDLYLNMAIGFLNSVPPPVMTYTIENFPLPGLLIHRAAIDCMISNSIMQARNELSYNNGGISVKFPDGNRYSGPLQMLTSVFNQELEMLRQLKISINIEGGWGGVNSPYQYIAGYPYLIRPYNGLG